ncbi:MAG: 5'/3'-nucleotidase SurE [Chloroflexi bacterium]|nr:5'/3'-nucleotidase SurE [Chloroflexota bacterium]
MYILITNDDGVDAPGLLALKNALQSLAKTIVVAPNRNWSAAGHTKTLYKPLRVDSTLLRDGSPAYATDGAPTDCVALVMLGLFSEKPALVVSGINPAGNLAHDVTYSGTVAAAMEGAINHIPSLAVSLDAGNRADADFSAAGEIALQLARRILATPLPRDTFLNINIPAIPRDQIRGLRITRLGTRIYRDALVERMDPSGKKYYWIGGDTPTGLVEEGTDIGALAHNFVSITPIHLDLTSHALIDQLKVWENNLDLSSPFFPANPSLSQRRDSNGSELVETSQKLSGG